MKRFDYESILKKYDQKYKLSIALLICLFVLLVAIFVTGILVAQYDYKIDIMIGFSIPLGILAMVISGFFIFGFLENRRKRKQIYFILGGYLSSVNGTIQEIKQSITTVSGRKGIEMIIKEEDKTSAVYYDEVFGDNPFKVGDSVSLQISESFIIEYEVNNG